MATQTPFIFTASVKVNILLDKPLDQPRYDQVVDTCGLSADLLRLSDGDETQLGERGTSSVDICHAHHPSTSMLILGRASLSRLSGGQKARVSLARAVYSDCDLVLLDDVFSALDGYDHSAPSHLMSLTALRVRSQRDRGARLRGPVWSCWPSSRQGEPSSRWELRAPEVAGQI